jgi:hypothetical protein
MDIFFSNNVLLEIERHSPNPEIINLVLASTSKLFDIFINYGSSSGHFMTVVVGEK